MPKNDPVLHDEMHIFQYGDAAQRVARDRHQVGEESGCHPAEPVAPAEQAGVHRGGGPQGLQRGGAVLHQQAKFARVVAVRKDPRVAAVAEHHPRLERGPHAGPLGPDAGRLGIHALAPAAILQDRVARRDGGTERHPPVAHQPEHLRRAAVPVVDGRHPGLHRTAHPLGSGGVGHHGPARGSGHLHDPAQLLRREGRPRFAARPPPVVGVHLDPVRPAPDLVAGHPGDPLEPVGLLRTEERRRGLGGKPPRGIAPRGHDGPRGDHQPGPRDDPLLDGPLEPHVRVSGALGAQVAEGRETRAQRPLRMDHRARHPERQRLPQDLVVPRRLVIGMQQQVAVQVDQPRQEREPRQFHGHRLRRDRHRRRRTGRFDPVPPHHHHPAGVDPVGHAIEDPGRAQHGHHRGLRRHTGGHEREGQQGPEDTPGHGVRI